ncbi:hypothetical protein KKI24_25435 [bacterium]|nr:hypothetical protein [bacterium]
MKPDVISISIIICYQAPLWWLQRDRIQSSFQNDSCDLSIHPAGIANSGKKEL